MTPVLSAIVALAVAALALTLMRRTGRLPLNVPNDRSLHSTAIPRGGGLSIWAGCLAAIACLRYVQPWLIPLCVLVAVSLWDDRYGVPVALRLAAQLACAAFWVWATAPTVNALSVPNALVTIAVIVCAANFYNFMDGSDGLAGVMTLTGFGAYAYAAMRVDSPSAPFQVAMVAAALPFVALNLPPARIFLGDVGSVPLGFLAAVFGIAGVDAGYWPFWFPLLVFLPFIADAAVTLTRRGLRGHRVWRAHRDHYYQRLVRIGFGHRGVLALYGTLMVGTATSALAALARSPASGIPLLCLWSAVHLVTFVAVDYAWRRSDHGLDESKC
jgi:UDP-N-acetylmuramyl pentapeptide phosphotransferase/UDP-N-acetylglucosamine-1-phosphate transferase